MGKYKLPLGFRFHPTDVELLKYYLKRKVLGKKFSVEAIAELDIYKHAPWDLPDMSLLQTGDLKWYFFCPIEKKYGRGARFNRATDFGYWKTTGKDRPVMYNEEVVGIIKTLVFHRGKAPRGDRTDWVMHEYRLEEKELADRGIVQDAYVLCVVFKKDGWGPRNGAQYGAPFKEEDWSDDEDDNLVGPGSISALCTQSFGGASSSHVPESLCTEPSIPSSGLFTLPLVADPDAAVSHTPGIDSMALPLLVATDTNDALTCMDTPQVPVVVDDEAVPAIMEAPQLAQVPQAPETSDDILSLLDFFTEDDAAFCSCDNGGNANNFTPEAPHQVSDNFTPEAPHQVSDDDDISLMLESFREHDDWNNMLYPFHERSQNTYPFNY